MPSVKRADREARSIHAAQSELLRWRSLEIHTSATYISTFSLFEHVKLGSHSGRPRLIIHGYSDQGKSFIPLAKALEAKGISVDDINIASWISLSNEITLKDVGEALERALRDPALNGKLADKEFDAIVHSTGMLVVRSGLAGNPSVRIPLLKHLIALAPATFGSPLAAPGTQPARRDL